MPNIRVRFDAGKLEAILTGLSARANDLSEVWRGPVDTLLTKVLEERFASEGSAYSGAPWAALTQRTIKGRQKPGRGRGGILYDTGRLRASLITGEGEGLKIVQPRYYDRGTITSYARFHQHGTSRMPARPIFNTELGEQIAPIVKRWLTAFIRTGEVNDT